jgi:hypothetical protein
MGGRGGYSGGMMRGGPMGMEHNMAEGAMAHAGYANRLRF